MGTVKPKAVVAWSSGKDCAYALFESKHQGNYDIVGLFTTINETSDRVAMHGTRSALLQKQADALGLDLITVPLPWPCSNEIYETRTRLAFQQMIDQNISVIIFGDLFLEDVRAYRETQLQGTGITPVFPIWGRDTYELVQDMIKKDFDIRVVTCDPRVLDQSYVGRQLNKRFLDDLPKNVDPCGENGEFHTAVVNMPLFSGPIKVSWGPHETRDGFHYADLILTEG
jgi:uncharacterized protein (TIGR00290 family)